MMENNPIPEYTNKPVLFLSHLQNKPEDYWIRRGEQRALGLFNVMAKRVPAYKDFLKKEKINPKSVKTVKDFQRLPLLDKHNYLLAYPLEKLCLDGSLKLQRSTFAATSGSTGEPFYFPRQIAQDRQYALTAELYLRTNFNIHKKSTLYIDGFAMGAWIGGLFTYQTIRLVAERGKYPLSIITPGIFKEEIIKSLKRLGPYFDQIIIGGYPPFIKDVIDDCVNQGIDLKQYNIGGFVFSAEGFSETFRDYILEKTGLFSRPYTSTLNHYGTVDLGTMSHETPVSILLRRMAVKNDSVYTLLFGRANKLPTFTQFVPEMFFFEDLNENLVCSAFSGIPLVRYDLKDHGGVKKFSDIKNQLDKAGVSLTQKIADAKIEKTVWNLPFVYVYERSDFAVSLYGANIYPETIRKVLQEKAWNGKVSGKFTMMIQYDRKQNPYLEINTELKKGMVPSEKMNILLQDDCAKALRKENSEYRSNYERLGKRAVPRVIFWEYEHPKYFRPGVKQKWVIK